MKSISGSGLSRQEWLAAIYAAIVAFLTYATVFGFRKTYTVGTFDDMRVFGLGYKEVLVIVQAIGYLSSKFFGIRFISEMKRFGRWKIILILIFISWMAWLFFALIPAPYNIIFLFLNGFPLGLIWGVVFSYVEGRRATDFIGAAMAVSFIFSSGLIKSVGQFLMIHFGVSETWLPFVAGAVFFPLLLVFMWLMEKIPPPGPLDIEARTERTPMSKSDRKHFVRQFLPGIVILVLLYVFLTVFRDIRDNFVADMWKELGYFNQPELFTKTETPVALATLVLVGSLILVRNNFRAFMLIHLIVIAGFIVAGFSTYLFVTGSLDPVIWITLAGLGLYMGYIPYNCVLFERLIASFRVAGNVGFLIYIADSFGYLGSVSVILSRAILGANNIQIQWTTFFSNSVLVLSVFGVAGGLASMFYFYRKQIRGIRTNKTEKILSGSH